MDVIECGSTLDGLYPGGHALGLEPPIPLSKPSNEGCRRVESGDEAARSTGTVVAAAAGPGAGPVSDGLRSGI